jgi:hypothetical protein
MLLASGLPQSFWALAVLYAVWLHNRALTKQTGPKSPHEAMTGKRPDLKRTRRFGCKVWVHENEGVWVGPSSTIPDGHKVYWPGARTTTVECSVRFEDGTEFGGETSAEIPVEVPSSGQQKPMESGVQHTSEPPTNHDTPMAPTNTPETEPAREESTEIEASTLQVEDVTANDEPNAPAAPEDDNDVGEDLGPRVRKPSACICQLQDGEGVTSGAGGQFHKYTRGLQVPNADRHERAQKAYAVSIFCRGEHQNEVESAEPDLKMMGEEELVPDDAQHRSHVNVKARVSRAGETTGFEWRIRRASTPQAHPQDVDRRGTGVFPFPGAFRRRRHRRSNTR